jgi:tryptophan-rich sensory protein
VVEREVVFCMYFVAVQKRIQNKSVQQAKWSLNCTAECLGLHFGLCWLTIGFSISFSSWLYWKRAESTYNKPPMSIYQ